MLNVEIVTIIYIYIIIKVFESRDDDETFD